MAAEFPRVVTPRLPRELAALFFYLADRDVGAPSIQPVAGTLTTSATSPEVDTLTWNLTEERPPGEPTFRRADGFLVAVALGDTAAPWETGAIFRCSAQARAFVMPGWPNGTARSYALAAFRATWQGEQATGWVQPATWKNVT